MIDDKIITIIHVNADDALCYQTTKTRFDLVHIHLIKHKSSNMVIVNNEQPAITLNKYVEALIRWQYM